MFHHGGPSAQSFEFSTFIEKENREEKKKEKSACYDLITKGNARIYKLILLQHKIRVEWRRVYRINSYPPSEHNLVDAYLKSNVETSIYTSSVWT